MGFNTTLTNGYRPCQTRPLQEQEQQVHQIQQSLQPPSDQVVHFPVPQNRLQVHRYRPQTFVGLENHETPSLPLPHDQAPEEHQAVSIHLLFLSSVPYSDRTAVVVGTVTDDQRVLDMPAGLKIAALRFTESARARVPAAGGKCMTLDELVM